MIELETGEKKKGDDLIGRDVSSCHLLFFLTRFCESL